MHCDLMAPQVELWNAAVWVESGRVDFISEGLGAHMHPGNLSAMRSCLLALAALWVAGAQKRRKLAARGSSNAAAALVGSLNNNNEQQ